jgi:hypothetical protein
MEKLTHQKQYELLREEIMQYIRQIHITEMWAAAAVGASYTWLIIHKKDQTAFPPVLWFIPPGIMLLAAARCWALVCEMWRIGRYLRHIEEFSFGDSPKHPGWERFKKSGKRHFFDTLNTSAGTFIWLVAFVLSLVLSWELSRNDVTSSTNSPGVSVKLPVEVHPAK